MSDSDDKIEPVKSGIERAREERALRLRDLEDTILIRAATVVDSMLSWAEVDAQQAEPPPEWVREFGEQGAQHRLRVAKAAWMPQSEAPVGLKTSAQVMVGIAKARGQGKQPANQQLNVMIQLPAPTSKAHEEGAERVEVIDVDP